MKKYFLIIPDLPLTKQRCLKHLLAALEKHTVQTLIRELSCIGNTLEKASSREDGNKILTEKYAQGRTLKDLKNQPNINEERLLFTREALNLVDTLLRITPPSTSISNLYVSESKKSSYIYYNGLFVPKSAVNIVELPIVGIFLLANFLITTFEAESFNCISEYSEKNKIFYSRYKTDPASAIGRTNLYTYEDFPARIKDRLGIDVEDYLDTIFALCSHVASQDCIQIRLSDSLKAFPAKVQTIFSSYISLLSSKLHYNKLDLKTIEDNLPELYFTEKLCNQKPLLEVNDFHYCLQPNLLWSALANLPYFLLLDSCNKVDSEVKNLGKAWGDAFEKKFQDLGNRVFGLDKCKEHYYKKNHRIGDLFVEFDKDTHIIIECKGMSSDNEMKKGDRSKARIKFTHENENKKGVSQLVKDSSIYRNETSFSENLYIILICRGPFPLTKDFDSDTEQYLQKHAFYQEHIKIPENKPLIWLDALSAEVLLSGFRQGLPVKETLDYIAGKTPTQTAKRILEKIDQYKLTPSAARLYEEEIEIRKQRFISLFK